MEQKSKYLSRLAADGGIDFTPTERLPVLETTAMQSMTETARLILEDAVPKAVGYDPFNSADKIEPGERPYLLDALAEEERKREIRERSGVPKHALDWIEGFINEI